MKKGPKKWPFPEDSNVARARKMALAYRNVAQEQAALIDQYRTATQIIVDAVNQADRRLLAYDSPKTLAALAEALKNAQAALDNTGAGNPVNDLDRRFTSWGEAWHCEQPTEYEDDDYVPTAVGAKLIGISAKTLTDMRNTGRIDAQFNEQTGIHGGYWYQVADLYTLARTMRGRAWRSSRHADNLNANGTGDSK